MTLSENILLDPRFTYYHANLSNQTSGLEQKCTQLLTPFSDIEFYAPSHSVIPFRVLAPGITFGLVQILPADNQKSLYLIEAFLHHILRVNVRENPPVP